MSQAQLEAALAGRAGEGVTVLRGTRPPALDGPTLRAASTPLMAAFMVAAAVLRARMEPFALDPMGLALRTLALAFILRAVVDVTALVRKLLRDGSAARHALAWDAHGLLLQTPSGARYVPRAAIAAVVTPPARRPGEARRRARPLWLALWPGAQGAEAFVTVPPYFAADADVLQARLSRWLGDAPLPDEAGGEGGSDAPVWTARRAPGFWKRAPLGWLLLGVFCLDALRVAPEGWREALRLPALSMAVLTAIAPAAWIAWVHRRTQTPGGLLLSVSLEHVTAIARTGSVALGWDDVSSVALTRKARWSPFEGGYAVTWLEIRAQDGSLLRFDSSLLDVPLEVVAVVAARLADVDLEDD